VLRLLELRGHQRLQLTASRPVPDLDVVRLPDGRRLEVYTSGPVDGLPLVYHHGTPGSALPERVVERAAHGRGLRLVCASRPGYGTSDPCPGRRVVDVVEDTRAVLEYVGADRCLVLGWSGGGPHALACGARLDGVVGVLVIAGVAPYDADGLDWMAGMGQDNVVEIGAALQGEAALRSYLDQERTGMEGLTVELLIASMESVLPEVDQAVLTDEFGEDMVAGTRQALLSGVEGWLEDDLAFVAPWGFDLAEVGVPTMVWQGSEDLMVPIAHGRWLGDRLPGATVHLEDGGGHLSVAIGALDRMLDELVAAAD
jgi:pimeloyl-ACP methyl ester carboxylesterase